MKKVFLAGAMMLSLCCKVQADNWMKYLPDNAFVVDVSIPGSHDTATGHGWSGLVGALGGPTYGTTQELTLAEQWNIGVRAFDLRPKVNGSRLAVNHGVLQTKLYFDDALKQLCGFLKDNPTEFVVVHLLYADGFSSDKDKYKTMLLDLLGSDDVKDYLVDFRKDLTVKDMRGKILLLSRDPYDSKPVGGFFNGWGNGVYWNISISGTNSSATLHVQDMSATYGLEDEKSKAIRELLNFSTKHIANTASDVVWSFNLASAYDNEGTSTSNGYRSNAASTHPVYINYLKDNPAGPTGVVLMDYVGVDNTKTGNYKTRGLELLNAIIDNNWRYLPKVSEEKMISVPFYAYKTTGWTCTTGNSFRVNTGSTEELPDGSGIITPFFEGWTNKGSNLGDGEIAYTLSDCEKGYYKVNIMARILNEAGGSISGASLFANESSVTIANGKPCNNGIISNYSVIGTVDENGELKFGFKIVDAAFNKIAFAGIEVEYLGEEITAEDGGCLMNPICEKTVKEAYKAAQEAFEDNPSMETYNAMSEAYREAEPSIEAYKALAEALNYADDAYAEASVNATEDSKAEYLNIINQIKDKYTNGEYADSEIDERIIPQVYSALAALLKSVGSNVDMTSLVVNNSFETGDLTGWTLPYGVSDDTGVMAQSNATYAAEGCDGKYLFNTWWKGVPITQTIAGLPNGRYRLDALVASDGATVYLTANGGHNDGTETGGSYPSKETFQEASYEFDVTDGTATIGAVGSADGAAGVHKSYRADGYWWYKADNFRLTYIDSYLSSIAQPFAGSGELEAGKWYVYNVDEEGDYDFSTIDGIEITAVDVLMGEVTSEPLSATTVGLSAGQLYFKSAASQSLTIAKTQIEEEEPDAINSAMAENETVDVYSLNGVLVRKGVKTLDGLPKGVYIIGGVKKTVR